MIFAFIEQPTTTTARKPQTLKAFNLDKEHKKKKTNNNNLKKQKKERIKLKRE